MDLGEFGKLFRDTLSDSRTTPLSVWYRVLLVTAYGMGMLALLCLPAFAYVTYELDANEFPVSF